MGTEYCQYCDGQRILREDYDDLVSAQEAYKTGMKLKPRSLGASTFIKWSKTSQR